MNEWKKKFFCLPNDFFSLKLKQQNNSIYLKRLISYETEKKKNNIDSS